MSGQIRQLVISPLGDFLAIATSHTVHVAQIPAGIDPTPTESLRLRTFQLGPTAHVLEQSPIASLLWHPFGTLGTALVTVTVDACVRLWELNIDSRHSFDDPALALDLKKLANATSSGQDLRASVYGTSKGFSPDSVEMEVAAASFGGSGTADEHGWAPMTLWIAMTQGDVYALCPLLPSKWQPAASTISSLTPDVVAKATLLQHDQSASEFDKRNAVKQQDWLADIDAQDPAMVTLPNSYDTVPIYSRPAAASSIPKLQGPFRLTNEPDLEGIVDIHVIAPRTDNVLADDEELEDRAPKRPELSVGLVALLTRDCAVYVCLDVQGIEAQWLPTKSSSFRQPFDQEQEPSDLLLYEMLDLASDDSRASEAVGAPSFTALVPHRYAAEDPGPSAHPAGRYAFYVTTALGVYSCNLTPWLGDLQDELDGPDDTGSSFRAGLLYESESTLLDHILTISDADDVESTTFPSSAVSLFDSALGHVVLSVHANQPLTATIQLPAPQADHDVYAPDHAPLALTGPEPRQAYQPHSKFYVQSTLPSFIDNLTQSGKTRLMRADMKSHVRLSPATLQLLTEAHRVLSSETFKLGTAAADLFRRCQRMQAELAEQVGKINMIAARADSITGRDQSDRRSNGNADDPSQSCKHKLEGRVQHAQDNARKLTDRVDALRAKIACSGSRELSKREEAWHREVDAVEQSLGQEAQSDATADHDDDQKASVQHRFDTVNKVTKDMMSRAKAAAATQSSSEVTSSPTKPVDDSKPDKSLSASVMSRNSDTSNARRGSMLSDDFRKHKLQHVMALLERETALVDAVSERLERLSVLT